MAFGQLEKMKVLAYNDPHCDDAHKVGEFSALVNPETYSMEYRAVFNDAQAQGQSAAQPRYVFTAPEEMAFDFLFDSTGLLGNASATQSLTGAADSFLGTGGALGAIASAIGGSNSVYEPVENFKKLVLEYDSSSHEPRHFRVVWGKLIFRGRCTGLSITYKLFNPDGTPIRAVCRTTFRGSVEEKLRIATENAQSPDLTHLRVVKAGDTLPQLCYLIYGDPRHYIEVARANGLTDFRSIKQGDELHFPPLTKS